MKIPRPKRTPKPSPKPSDEDVALFHEAIGDGIQRVESDLAIPNAPKPPPLPLQSKADERAVILELLTGPVDELEAGELVSYVRGGASKKVLRKLGKGEYSVRDELDLHGMNSAMAASAIAQFIDENKRGGRLCLRIIHGKGMQSERGPVLKQLTDKLLRQRGDVLAFRSARSNDGGSGAVIVLLRGDH